MSRITTSSRRHFSAEFSAAMSDSRRERQERFAAGLAARQAEQLAKARKLDEERIARLAAAHGYIKSEA